MEDEEIVEVAEEQRKALDKRLGKRLIAETRLQRAERQIERAMNKALAVHQERAVAALGAQSITASAPPDAFDAVTWETTVNTLITPIIEGVLIDQAAYVTAFLSLTPEQRAYLLGAIDIDGQLAQFLNLVTSIGPETAERVNEELAVGVAKGEGTDKLTRRIGTAFDIGRSSAQRIARTETHGAVESTTYQSTLILHEAGITMTKSWLATSDSRCRKTHRKAEEQNQNIPMDADFVVGKGAGPHPGRIGRAEEDINCRCSVAYEPMEDEEPEQQYSAFKGIKPDLVNDEKVAEELYSYDYETDRRYERRKVDPKTLYAGQDGKLDQGYVDKLTKEGLPEFDPETPPIVAVIDGLPTMIDGHHRAAAAAARGEKVEVQYFKEPIRSTNGKPYRKPRAK